MKFLKIGAAQRKGGRPLIPVERIREQLASMERLGFKALGLVLLGGTRLRVLRLLEKPENRFFENVRHPHGGYEPRLACLEGFCRAYLGETHGRKKYHYVYWPGGPEILEAARAEISGQGYKEIKDKLTHSGIEIGLFRDFATQRLEQLAHENNIRLDAVNMVVSRELSVTGAHYLDTRNWADRLFSIYARWLRAHGSYPGRLARVFARL